MAEVICLIYSFLLTAGLLDGHLAANDRPALAHL